MHRILETLVHGLAQRPGLLLQVCRLLLEFVALLRERFRRQNGPLLLQFLVEGAQLGFLGVDFLFVFLRNVVELRTRRLHRLRFTHGVFDIHDRNFRRGRFSGRRLVGFLLRQRRSRHQHQQDGSGNAGEPFAGERSGHG